jgi:hypothetical protein
MTYTFNDPLLPDTPTFIWEYFRASYHLKKKNLVLKRLVFFFSKKVEDLEEVTILLYNKKNNTHLQIA